MESARRGLSQPRKLAFCLLASRCTEGADNLRQQPSKHGGAKANRVEDHEERQCLTLTLHEPAEDWQRAEFERLSKGEDDDVIETVVVKKLGCNAVDGGVRGRSAHGRAIDQAHRDAERAETHFVKVGIVRRLQRVEMKIACGPKHVCAEPSTDVVDEILIADSVELDELLVEELLQLSAHEVSNADIAPTDLRHEGCCCRGRREKGTSLLDVIRDAALAWQVGANKLDRVCKIGERKEKVRLADNNCNAENSVEVDGVCECRKRGPGSLVKVRGVVKDDQWHSAKALPTHGHGGGRGRNTGCT
eukprot:m.263044 g.263044  ORF g.263044 m.263044 type:complete len:304 (+) comp26305_c0_seq1:90-1001(+)